MYLEDKNKYITLSPFFIQRYKIESIYRAPGFAGGFFTLQICLALQTYFQIMNGSWLLAVLSGCLTIKRMYGFAINFRRIIKNSKKA